MKHLYLFIAVLILTSCQEKVEKQTSQPEEKFQTADIYKDLQPEVAAIAKAHGLDKWSTVNEVAFTFNVDRGGKNVAQRSWIWNPQSEDITMITATDTISYNRNAIESESVTADQGFINDKFWLLAPFQMAWDDGTEITTETEVPAPLSQKPMKKITLTYVGDGGYTPGDAYDFYYINPGKIEEWVFRKGNAPEPSMITTFEGYKNLEGMYIATDHTDKDGNFRLYFTDVAIKTGKNE